MLATQVTERSRSEAKRLSFSQGRVELVAQPAAAIASAPLWLRDSNMFLCVTEIREGWTPPETRPHEVTPIRRHRRV